MPKKYVEDSPLGHEINRRFGVGYSYPWRHYPYIVNENAKANSTTAGQIMRINILSLLLAATGSLVIFYPLVYFDTHLLFDILAMCLWVVWIPTASWFVVGRYIKNGTLKSKRPSR